MEHYNLAFGIGTVRWNGTAFVKVDEKQYASELECMKRAGVSQVMLGCYSHPAELKFDFDVEEEMLHLGRILREFGIKPNQMHGISATWGRNAEEQRVAVDHIKTCVDYTANLGAENLVLHMGRCPTGRYETSEKVIQIYLDEVKKCGFESFLKRNIEAVREAGEYAAKKNVRIALENLDRYEPLGNQEQLPQVVEGVNLPNVGYCFDCGHAWCGGADLEKWLRIMGRKTFTTHFHDNRGPTPEMSSQPYYVPGKDVDEHLTPGLGTIDWRKVVSWIEKYTDLDTVTFETAPWPIEDKDDAYHCAITFWRIIEKMKDEVKGE